MADLFDKIKGAATSAAGLGLGIYQAGKANNLSAQADKLIPSPEDPEVRNFYDLIRRKARAIETGTDPTTALGKKLISKSQATTQGNVVRASSGDARQVIAGLTRTGKATGDAVSSLIASREPASQYYTSLGSSILGKISSRKFDLKMSQRAQKLREAGEMKTASSRNISGALGFGLPV